MINYRKYSLNIQDLGSVRHNKEISIMGYTHERSKRGWWKMVTCSKKTSDDTQHMSFEDQ